LLQVLFREPFGSIHDPNLRCVVDVDVQNEEWDRTLLWLIEVILLSDTSLSCIRQSSMPTVAWMLMVTFLLINVIMLINLLIALSA
jgi:hypothetical protein